MNSLASVRADADVLPRALQLTGGLVRLHVVEKDADPLLWELLRRFGEHEPAPILVNTSFNLPGEPPVIRPKERSWQRNPIQAHRVPTAIACHAMCAGARGVDRCSAC